ncbi:MAG: EAL domain-containing protein [Chromatiaceae bacterium]|nr:EAL domain-containing protein [Chromatiaceae bacterium]
MATWWTWYTACCRDSGLPSDKLELELTESFIMGESQNAIRILQDLRDLGVTLAVGDFGTGYSSRPT